MFSKPWERSRCTKHTKSNPRAAGIIHHPSELPLSRGEITPLRPLTQEKGFQKSQEKKPKLKGHFNVNLHSNTVACSHKPCTLNFALLLFWPSAQHTWVLLFRSQYQFKGHQHLRARKQQLNLVQLSSQTPNIPNFSLARISTSKNYLLLSFRLSTRIKHIRTAENNL